MSSSGVDYHVCFVFCTVLCVENRLGKFSAAGMTLNVPLERATRGRGECFEHKQIRVEPMQEASEQVKLCSETQNNKIKS